MRDLLIYAIVACTIVTPLPLKRDGEQSEGCPADYCSMFEGICQNGGTCVNKGGCKGDCVCAKGFFGVNCDVTEISLTSTPAPTPQAETPQPEKKNNDNKSRDFSLILSLFRMVSGPRPGDNDIGDRREAAKEISHSSRNKNESQDAKKDKKKNESEFKSNERREGYPSRPDVFERKQRKSEGDTSKGINFKTNDRRVGTDIRMMISSPDRRTRVLPTSTNVAFPVSEPKDAKSTDSNDSRRAQYKKDKYRKRQNINSEKEIRTSSSFQTLTGEKKISDTETANPLVFSGINIGKNVFQSTTGETTEDKIKPTTTTTISPVDISSRIGETGHKVLSSTTLSNLYLTHTLLSKSRIFISNIKHEEPNKRHDSILSSGQDIAEHPSQIEGASISRPVSSNKEQDKNSQSETDKAATKSKVVVKSASDGTTEAEKLTGFSGSSVVTITSSPTEEIAKTTFTNENSPLIGSKSDSDKIDNISPRKDEASRSSNVEKISTNNDSSNIHQMMKII